MKKNEVADGIKFVVFAEDAMPPSGKHVGVKGDATFGDVESLMEFLGKITGETIPDSVVVSEYYEGDTLYGDGDGPYNYMVLVVGDPGEDSDWHFGVSCVDIANPTRALPYYTEIRKVLEDAGLDKSQCDDIRYHAQKTESKKHMCSMQKKIEAFAKKNVYASLE